MRARASPKGGLAKSDGAAPAPDARAEPRARARARSPARIRRGGRTVVAASAGFAAAGVDIAPRCACRAKASALPAKLKFMRRKPTLTEICKMLHRSPQWEARL